MFFDINENQWIMLLTTVFILWFFLQLTKEKFDPSSYNASAKNDIEQSGTKKWKYMYEWIQNGNWI